jgi:hypothetical protein
MCVRTQNQVVTLPTPREIFQGVINDMVCANGSRSVRVPRTAHSNNFSPEPFRNLDREPAHVARGAIDQDLLTWLNPFRVAKTLKRSYGRHGYGCCVLERYVSVRMNLKAQPRPFGCLSVSPPNHFRVDVRLPGVPAVAGEQPDLGLRRSPRQNARSSFSSFGLMTSRSLRPLPPFT